MCEKNLPPGRLVMSGLSAPTGSTGGKTPGHLAVAAASATMIVGLVLTIVPHTIAADSPAGSETPFLAENNVAMSKMMRGMAVTPSGDVDRDFVAMMVPHHQGAIDMALAELRHGKNRTLKRIAQEIIVTQQQEIAAMRLAVGEPLPPSLPSPTEPDGVLQ
jgi:hypothetical protein